MALEDIERLKEKVDKDPNSKLFIPLAEEYKKAGMYNEAIDVLKKGIERQPGYMSAYVSLGKIYIERDMLKEAKVEFEKVISEIPDNLYAHKKLAEIYRDLGEKDRAMKEFETVLQLNPMDEWAVMSLEDFKAPKTVEHIEKSIFEQETETPSLSLTDADPYILQEKYMEAMNVYRKILSIEPGNIQVMQRIEELKALLKLLGKDKEELIAKLDNLLAGIKKRRDEVLGS